MLGIMSHWSEVKEKKGTQIPGLRDQDLFQIIHRRCNGDVDILRPAPATSQVYRPAADKGICDFT